MAEAGFTRRRVLNVMIAGVATTLVLPGKWSKPIVNAIVAPAHAVTSPPRTTAPPTTGEPGSTSTTEAPSTTGTTTTSTTSITAWI